MKIRSILLAITCLSCGTQDKLADAPNRMQSPCKVKLTYEHTKVSGKWDLPIYSDREVSENCKEYIGVNIQELRYRLDVRAKESVGNIEQISIDGRRVPLIEYALTDSLTVVDDVNTSDVDNGPIQIESIWVAFLFPKDTEKSLYPSLVELTITKKK